jgi:hypothetical protein
MSQYHKYDLKTLEDDESAIVLSLEGEMDILAAKRFGTSPKLLGQYIPSWKIVGAYQISKVYKLWKRIPRFIRFFVGVFLFFSDNLEAGWGNGKVITSWILKDENGDDIVQYKRVHRGVKMYRADKKVGEMVFKKRTFICKYETAYEGRYLGKVFPKSVSHIRFELRKDQKVLMVAQKLNRYHEKKDMKIAIHQSVSPEDLPGMLGVFLL